jgi:SET domain-containing protein
MLYLCSEKLCPNRRKCTNLPFNFREPLSLPNGEEATEVFYTGSRGFGLRTLVDIPKDTFIVEYRGEVISREESYKRVTGVYRERHD